MPRGFQRDEAATIRARFEDDRSFVSKPKGIKGECDTPKAHLVLYGFEDKGKVRAEIFRRNREKNGGENRCVKCGATVYENQGTADAAGVGYTYWRRGDWHHIRNKGAERCDCPENGEVICGGPAGCHRNEHPRPRWTAQEQAAQ